MWINYYKQLSLSYHYHTLQAEQNAQISKMASSLGVSIQELSFYFENIKSSLGNIDFFAFIFFIYRRLQILNNLRMINLNMSNWGASYKVSGGGSYGS
ncbi:MAG: hypothetical protein RMJ36_02190, partial [Candidatus Calescibacterium sp.]|nr:hypothetical protein [Candidatus Calescibacterium sp.]MDW8132449.1 hypothetical protein [Candidatus Calescibacterium sp.]